MTQLKRKTQRFDYITDLSYLKFYGRKPKWPNRKFRPFVANAVDIRRYGQTRCFHAV